MKGIASLTKVLCLVLAILLLVPALAACNDSGSDDENTTAATTTAQDEDETRDPATMHDIPSNLKYDGKTISMLVTNKDMQEDEFFLDEDKNGPSGELVPHAVYERNYAVENQLDIKLDIIPTDEYSNSVHQKDHQGGLGEYQIIADKTTNKGVMIVDNYYHNLNNFEYLDLDKKYWSQGFGSVVTFGEEDKQYLATGALAVSLYRMMFATIYNQKDLATYGIDDPYRLVMDGEWTLDAQKAIISNKWEDGDGDSKPSEGDYFGFLSGVQVCMDPYLTASNVVLIKKNTSYNWQYDEDELSYLVDVVEKVQALTTNESTFLFDKSKDQSHTNDIILKFAEKEGLMATIMFYTLEKNIGEINFDYGIAPIPKYSTNQENYYTYVQDMVTSVGVNSIVSDEETLECIGATLESMAYHSGDYIEKAYFQKTMLLKFLKDPKMQDIINLMYDSVAIDFCGMMSSTMETIKLRDELRPILSSDGSVATYMASHKSALVRALRTINNKANKLP